MIQVLNKNSVTVPTEIIDAAVNAYEQGGQETYNLGTFDTKDVANTPTLRASYDIDPPSM